MPNSHRTQIHPRPSHRSLLLLLPAAVAVAAAASSASAQQQSAQWSVRAGRMPTGEQGCRCANCADAKATQLRADRCRIFVLKDVRAQRAAPRVCVRAHARCYPPCCERCGVPGGNIFYEAPLFDLSSHHQPRVHKQGKQIHTLWLLLLSSPPSCPSPVSRYPHAFHHQPDPPGVKVTRAHPVAQPQTPRLSRSALRYMYFTPRTSIQSSVCASWSKATSSSQLA